MTTREAIAILGEDRAAEIRRLAREDGVPEETNTRLRFAAQLTRLTEEVAKRSPEAPTCSA